MCLMLSLWKGATGTMMARWKMSPPGVEPGRSPRTLPATDGSPSVKKPACPKGGLPADPAVSASGRMEQRHPFIACWWAVMSRSWDKAPWRPSLGRRLYDDAVLRLSWRGDPGPHYVRRPDRAGGRGFQGLQPTVSGAPGSIFSSYGGEEGPFDRIQSSSHCVMNCGLWWISTCTKRSEPELMNL